VRALRDDLPKRGTGSPIHYREQESQARALYDELAQAGYSVLLVSGDITDENQVQGHRGFGARQIRLHRRAGQ
jgi:hypothetical protein